MEKLHAITVLDEERLVESEQESMQEIVVNNDKVEVSQNKQKSVGKEYKPRVPYPNATKKDHTNEQFGNCFKLLKKLHINLPFIETLS